jgi:hypothetical protein
METTTMKPAVFVIALLVLCPASAPGQPYFFDDFESYPPNQRLAPQTLAPPANGGWVGWNNLASNAGTVLDASTNPALPTPPSGTKMLRIAPGVDCVQPFSLTAGSGIAYPNYTPSPPTSYPTTCQWTLSMSVYLPTGGTGDVWVAWFGGFNFGGPSCAAGITVLDLSNLTFNDQFSGSFWGVPIALGQWLNLAFVFDLTGLTTSVVLNGTTISTGGFYYFNCPSVAALDIWSTNGGTAYVDDIRLERTSAMDYQVNQPEASLDVNGIMGATCAPAVLATVPGTSANLNLASTLTNAYDVAITAAPLVSASSGGLTTIGGQIVNLDFTTPPFWLLGTSFATPFPTAGVSIPFSLPFPVQVSAQMVVLNPATADQFTLSQAGEVLVTPCTSTQGFEGLPQGHGSYPPGWSDAPGAGYSWTLSSFGGTLSGGIGPSSAHSGTSFLFTDGSNIFNSGALPFIIRTCAMDTSTATGTFTFALSRWANPAPSGFGTVTLSQDDGTGTFPTVLGTWVGNDPTGQWSVYNQPFTPSAGGTDRFQISHTSYTSFACDVAIDSISIQ